jgi:hypothetical protein
MQGRESFSPPRVPAMPADENGRALHRQLLAFVLDDRQEHLRVAYKCSKFKRKQAHDLADGFGLEHVSGGKSEADAHVIVWKHGTQRPNRFPLSSSSSSSGAPAGVPVAASASGLPDSVTASRSRQPTAEEIKKILEAFVADNSQQYHNFPLTYDTGSRRTVHELAGKMQLDHDSFGDKGQDRYVRVTKIDPEIARQRALRQNGLNVAYQNYLEKVKQARLRTNQPIVRHVVPQCVSPAKLVKSGSFRVVQWNIEWMAYFFDEDTLVARFLSKNPKAEISDVDELCRSIAACVKQMDPDVMFVEEGPSTRAQMELFVAKYLDAAFTVLGGLENVTQQVYLLCRKNGPVSGAKLHAKVSWSFFFLFLF